MQHWLDAFNHAKDTGEVDPMLELSGPDCSACASFARQFGELYERGGQYDSEAWSIKSQRWDSNDSEDEPRRIVVVSIPSGSRVEKAGGKTKKFEAGQITFKAWMRWNDGWTMTEFEAISL